MTVVSHSNSANFLLVKNSGVKILLSAGRTHIFAFQEEAEVEGYFESQAYGSVTSDRTLAKLEMPRMDAETLTKTLEGMYVKIVWAFESSSHIDITINTLFMLFYDNCYFAGVKLNYEKERKALYEEHRSCF